jgi:hypothetical protein
MKKQKTFTINTEIYDKFSKLCKTKSINKSLFIENKMLEFIKINETNDEGK